jgi:hypothetical protein
MLAVESGLDSNEISPLYEIGCLEQLGMVFTTGTNLA